MFTFQSQGSIHSGIALTIISSTEMKITPTRTRDAPKPPKRDGMSFMISIWSPNDNTISSVLRTLTTVGSIHWRAGRIEKLSGLTKSQLEWGREEYCFFHKPITGISMIDAAVLTGFNLVSSLKLPCRIIWSTGFFSSVVSTIYDRDATQYYFMVKFCIRQLDWSLTVSGFSFS